MKIFINSQIYFLLLIIITSSCNSRNTDDYENPENAPITTIHLENNPRVIHPSSILGLQSSMESLYLSNPSDIVVLDSVLYVTDAGHGTIFALSLSGTILNKIGRKGEGPGEFGLPYEIFYSSNYFFVRDISRGFIHIFSNNFELIDQIPYFSLSPVSMGPEYLMLAGGIQEGSIFSLWTTSPPFKKTGNWLPLMTQDPLKGFFNSAVASHDNSHIYVLFNAQPFILIYDHALNLIHKIKFEGPWVDKFNLKSPDEVSSSGPVFIPGFASEIEADGQGRIYIVSGLATIVLEWVDSTLELVDMVTFDHAPESTISSQHGIHVEHITAHNNDVYTASRHEPYIFRYKRSQFGRYSTANTR